MAPLKVSLRPLFNWSYRSMLNIALALLVIDTLVDPTNLLFQLKYLLFGLVFLVWLIKVVRLRVKVLLLPLPIFVVGFIALVMPFWALSAGIVNSAFNTYDLGTLAYFNSFFFFLLLPVILMERVDLTPYLNRGSLLIVAITFTFYGILLFNPGFFEVLYHYFVLKKGVVVYALRDYGDFTMLMLFYKTSPILVFPLSWLLYRLVIEQNRSRLVWNSITLLLIALTLFLSGTRANLLSLVGIFLFYGGFALYRASKKGFVLLLIPVALALLAMLPTTINLLFNGGEASNAIKLGHFTSYLDHFERHPLMAFFGQGVGGTFFTSGLNRMSSVSELTYLELIRIWGFPVTLCFVAVLLLPLWFEIRSRHISPMFIAYAAYLMIAGTNPLLLSSTGMIVLVYVFSQMWLNPDLHGDRYPACNV